MTEFKICVNSSAVGIHVCQVLNTTKRGQAGTKFIFSFPVTVTTDYLSKARSP